MHGEIYYNNNTLAQQQSQFSSADKYQTKEILKQERRIKKYFFSPCFRFISLYDMKCMYKSRPVVERVHNNDSDNAKLLYTIIIFRGWIG